MPRFFSKKSSGDDEASSVPSRGRSKSPRRSLFNSTKKMSLDDSLSQRSKSPGPKKSLFRRKSSNAAPSSLSKYGGGGKAYKSTPIPTTTAPSATASPSSAYEHGMENPFQQPEQQPPPVDDLESMLVTRNATRNLLAGLAVKNKSGDRPGESKREKKERKREERNRSRSVKQYKQKEEQKERNRSRSVKKSKKKEERTRSKSAKRSAKARRSGGGSATWIMPDEDNRVELSERTDTSSSSDKYLKVLPVPTPLARHLTNIKSKSGTTLAEMQEALRKEYGEDYEAAVQPEKPKSSVFGRLTRSRSATDVMQGMDDSTKSSSSAFQNHSSRLEALRRRRSSKSSVDPTTLDDGSLQTFGRMLRRADNGTDVGGTVDHRDGSHPQSRVGRPRSNSTPNVASEGAYALPSDMMEEPQRQRSFRGSGRRTSISNADWDDASHNSAASSSSSSLLVGMRRRVSSNLDGNHHGSSSLLGGLRRRTSSGTEMLDHGMSAGHEVDGIMT